MKTELYPFRGPIPSFWRLTTMILLAGVMQVPKLQAHEHIHTHSSLSVASVLFLDQADPADGALFSEAARERIRSGSILEDDSPNFLEHFYDPKTGLNTHIPSAAPRTTAAQRAGNFWAEATADFRSGNPTLAFEKLGRVSHLLQDMTSPAHVHNDAHAKVIGGEACHDGDDFENWGWSDCSLYEFHHIFDYVAESVSTDYFSSDQIRPPLALGLDRIFLGRPVRAGQVAGAPNAGYAYVHELANKVYDFTTFGVSLTDTSSASWDVGAGELKEMFPSLVEATAGRWVINEIGYSSGECGGAGPDWWLMAQGCQDTEDFFTHLDVGKAYIENTGGGSGALAPIPDDVIPEKYPRAWYKARYLSYGNPAQNSMLRIYGDVLYTAAVAFGAGLLQAFLDEAVMPKPTAGTPITLGSSGVRLNGHANAGGEPAAAWFEWGVDGSFANSTAQESLGNGTEWIAVTAVLEGLQRETTYQYRLVSSNRFGLRHGTNQVFSTPSYILSSAGSNAWRITDNSSLSGSTLTYSTDLSSAQQGAATTNGWRLTTTARLTPTVQGAKSMAVSYIQGTRRYLFWLDLDADGDLTIELDGQAARKLTANAAGATDYHTHDVQYENGQATYRFDGNVIVNDWAGIAATAGFPAGRVFWGAGSSPGKGEMNMNHVQFATGGSNLVVYDAGAGGDPAEAPDPILQEWTRNPGTSPVAEGPLSPDGEFFLTGAETLDATELNLEGARLNGRVDPRGNAAAAWFEWGGTSAYGNATAPLALAAGRDIVDVSDRLPDLIQGATYHYRLVASNLFGIRFGENRSFVMPNFLFSDTLPNAWRITDNSQVSGSIVNYGVTLTPSQRAEATSKGWRLATTTAITDNFGDTKTMIFVYGEGNRRFNFWLYHDTDGDLTVELDGETPQKLTSGGVGAADYHTHEIEFANGTATYRFNGNLIASGWDGLPIADWMGRVEWGAGSSPGRGEMKVHRVEFVIGGTNIIASYIAGTVGNPSTAPAPTTQGWTISPTTGTTRGAVSPDPVGFRPVPIVETAPAKFVGAHEATLEALVNTVGQPTAIWFEWGLSSEYGTQTLLQNANTDSVGHSVADVLSGLTVDTTYHFRIVASNAFTVSFGSDHTFRTRWFQDTGLDLAAVDVGAVAWGDYDNDGYLDLIITGQSPSSQTTQLYRNVDGEDLVSVESGFPPLNQSAVAWGDFDNDGYLDLLISGSNDEHGLHSELHRNAGDGTFADIQAGLPGLRWSSVAWADYDNDGDLDFILCGMNDATSSAVSRIYRNDGGTNFVNIEANLPGVYQGAVAWSDFDGDGDQDLVLTGNSNDQIPISRLYRNDGGGLFAEMAVEFTGVMASSVAWGDYDNDGDSDLLLTGWDGGTFLTHLFRNDRLEGSSIFIDATGSLPGISASSVAWGDHDNDGDLDLLMAGFSGTYSARIFRNDGVDGFVDARTEFAGVNWASAAWADFDNDGDLDALVSGSTASTRICHLYRNEVGVPNLRPGAPGNLNAITGGNTAKISWNPANDPAANSPLSYNVVLRSTTGGLELAAHMSDPATGFRRLPRIGNASDNLSLTFKGLKPGTYEFTVQAIDSALTGGPFAPFKTLEVLPLPIAIVGVQIPTAGEFRLQIGAPAGSLCQVFRSFDLSAWTAIGSAQEASPGEFDFLDGSAPASGAFYRIEATTP